MSAGLLRLLLLLSFAALIGLCVSGLLLSSADQRRRRVAARLAGVSQAATRGPAPVTPPIARAAARGRSTPVERLAGLLGCNWARRHAYPLRWWLVLAATCAAGRLGAWLATGVVGPLAIVLWPALWVVFSRALFGRWDGRWRDALLTQFPDALGMIVRSVRVGIPVPEAARLVGGEAADPTGAEFREISSEVAIGVSLELALRRAAERTGLPEYRFFATALSLQAQTGGGLSESLEMLADLIRRRVALRARGYALTSEARMSTVMLCAMPFISGLLLYLVSPDYMTVLFVTTTGHHMLAFAAGMLLTGVLIMRGLIRKTLA